MLCAEMCRSLVTGEGHRPSTAPSPCRSDTHRVTTTQRLLDLAAAAPACPDEDLVLLLTEANELYQQGLEDLQHTTAGRLGGLPTKDLVSAANAAGMPCDTSQDRTELLLLLALLEWERTPSAIAYTEMATDAARRGICLIPEE